jgi:hypothetical protein
MLSQNRKARREGKGYYKRTVPKNIRMTVQYDMIESIFANANERHIINMTWFV